MSRITLSADLIPDEEGGFTVYCPKLDIYTQGDTEDVLPTFARLPNSTSKNLEERQRYQKSSGVS